MTEQEADQKVLSIIEDWSDEEFQLAFGFSRSEVTS